MEIKIPKDVRSYKETVFFGLSMRQAVCSAIALAAAVGIYFGLRDILGQEIVSWLCILGAAPFAVAGFFSYNGMTLEKFLLAWFRSQFLCAGPRKFVAENYYYQMLCEIRTAGRRVRAKRPQAARRHRPKEKHGRKKQSRRNKH